MCTRHMLPALGAVLAGTLFVSLAAAGRETWATSRCATSSAKAGGMVFAMSGFRGNNLKAIDLAQARGDLTGTSAIALYAIGE